MKKINMNIYMNMTMDVDMNMDINMDTDRDTVTDGSGHGHLNILVLDIGKKFNPILTYCNVCLCPLKSDIGASSILIGLKSSFHIVIF
jgi:hypothetical protein